MNKELRKWSVEKAIEAGYTGEVVLEKAKEMYSFVESEQDSKTYSLTDNHPLTKSQKELVNKMIEMRAEGKDVNGSALGRELDISQTYASNILRKLIKIGYVTKNGNIYWAIRDAEGKALDA